MQHQACRTGHRHAEYGYLLCCIYIYAVISSVIIKLINTLYVVPVPRVATGYEPGGIGPPILPSTPHHDRLPDKIADNSTQLGAAQNFIAAIYSPYPIYSYPRFSLL